MHSFYKMDTLKDNKYIIQRLTALWALNESGLGGFMHALNLSFSGILVGGISIISISLIAYFSKSIVKSVLKALTIVLLIKLAVSPHSPLTAYFAVLFQAFIGIGLFLAFSFKKVVFLIFGMLTFAESALQKLLTLTIIYGMSLWEGLDFYGKWVTEKLSFLPNIEASKLLMLFFVSVYALLGLVVGFYINHLINRIQSIDSIEDYQLTVKKYQGDAKKKRSKRNKRLVFWLLTIAFLAIAFVYLDNDSDGWQKALNVIIRSLAVLFIWLFLVSPLLMKLLKKILEKRQSSYQQEIDHALSLFPYLKNVVSIAWKVSKEKKGLFRITEFVTNCVLYSMFFKIE